MTQPKIPEWWETNTRVYAQHVNRVSSIGHPCAFTNYLARACSHDREPPDEILRRIFEIGHMWEKHFMRKLFGSSVTIRSYQRDVEWADLQLVGHLDVVLDIDGEKVMVDFKSASPHAFRMLNTLDDLRNSPYHYHQNYVTQCSLYGIHESIEADWCGLLIANKVTGEWKQILWEPTCCTQEIEAAFSACEQINDHLANKSALSDVQEYLAMPGTYCNRCGWKNKCDAHWLLHEVPEYQALSDKVLVALVNKRRELANKIIPYSGALKEVEDELRSHFQAVGVGKYDFGRTKVKVGYTHGKEIPPKEAYVRKGYWRIQYVDDE